MGPRVQNIPPSSHLKPAFNPSASSTNHYLDLLQLEPEEDLIQLNSRPPTPHLELDQLDRVLVTTSGDTLEP